MRRVTIVVFLFAVLMVQLVSASSINVGFSVIDSSAADSLNEVEGSRTSSIWIFLLVLVAGVAFVLYKFNYLSSKKTKKKKRKKR